MTVIRDIQVIKKEQAQRVEPVRVFEPAVLVYVDSTDPENTAMVEGRPEYVWYQAFNQPQAVGTILNRAVPAIAGITVKIGYPEKPPFERQVLGLYNYDQIQNAVPPGGGSLNSSPHAQSHQYPSEATPGTDPVKIYQPALYLFKTETYTGLNVRVNPLNAYHYNGSLRSYMGGYVDLTSYVPSTANTHRYILLYLDPAYMTLYLVQGTDAPTTTSAPLPDIPDGGIASSYVLLANGQTEISQVNDIVDARAFLTPEVQDTGITAVFQWTWANQAARLAETGVTSADVSNYTLGLQLDDNTVWRATAVTPTWEIVSGGEYNRAEVAPNDGYPLMYKKDVLFSGEVTHSTVGWVELYPNGTTESFLFDSFSSSAFDIVVLGVEQTGNDMFEFRVEGCQWRGGVFGGGDITITNRYADRAGIELEILLTNGFLNIRVRDTTASGDTIDWQAYMRCSVLQRY